MRFHHRNPRIVTNDSIIPGTKSTCIMNANFP